MGRFPEHLCGRVRHTSGEDAGAKNGPASDSLIHGEAGPKLAEGQSAVIYDNGTFRSRLTTDRRRKGYRKNPVDTVWYRLKYDGDQKLYLRAGTFEPAGTPGGVEALRQHVDDLTAWLPLPTYNGLVFVAQRDKMLRPHGEWIYEALKAVAKSGASKDDMRSAALPLCRYATRARNAPGTPRFEDEALQVSGWAEKKAQEETPLLSSRDQVAVGKLYELPKSKPTGSGDKPLDIDEPLQKDNLANDLPPELLRVLRAHDPGAFETVQQPLDASISKKANLVQQTANRFFADATKSTATLRMVHGPWSYAKNLVDLESEDVSEIRLPLLRSRAQMSEVGILNKVHYKGNRQSDRAALDEVLKGMLKEKDTVALVDRHIRATPRRDAGAVHMQTVLQKVGSGQDAQWHAQWQMVRSLCHELMHVMAHPTFAGAVTKVERSQVIAERFVEVLGVELYNHILASAAQDEAFRQRLTDGLAKPDIPNSVASDALGYGEASQIALRIRKKVGEDRFQAAFFLGAVDRVGIK